MLPCASLAVALCVTLAVATGAAAQAGPAAAPSVSVAPSDIQLVNIDLSGTPFNSVQVGLLLAL